MSTPEELSHAAPSDDPNKSGLPLIDPDRAEQEQRDDIDDIIPTRGYQMLPLVGLGGSAGSIQALQRFFAAMPAESGMAFVVILHLAADHASIMPALLQRTTKMPVTQAQDGEKVQPNHVYVIPPGQTLTASDGHLRLAELQPERGKRVTVDLFFRSLADTHGPHGMAIILSGADSDGALGIKRIKERGGLTIAQDPDEAEHSSMPQSAIETGMVDWVLPVSEMPQRLLAFCQSEKQLRMPSEHGPHPAKTAQPKSDEDEGALRDVLLFLRTRTGRDFSYYKRATIVRRIARRMQVNGVSDLPAYLAFLRVHPGELGALLQDLLISVTNFFRDREAFEALEAQIPELFKGKKQGDVVRAWVAACATGEEAYSVAMLLLEHARRLDSPPKIQVFGCDLDAEAIQVARAGVYPGTIQADVSEERLRKFFTKEHHSYRVRREVREVLLFAAHDLLKDPPFSQIDLISCRNLMIYLNRDAQKRALEIFHFALRPNGRLFLGSSESVDDDSPLYSVLDKKHRIYMRCSAARVSLPLPISPSLVGRALQAQGSAKEGPVVPGKSFMQAASLLAAPANPDSEGERVSPGELHFKLIERFAPPSLIVDQNHRIVHLSELAGRFLQFSGGAPTMNLLHVVHPMLRAELRAALFRASETGVPVEGFCAAVDLEGSRQTVEIRVAPADDIAPGFLLVVFDVRSPRSESTVRPREEPESIVRHLEREIEQLKERLRDTVEQYEANGEELKASNEELQAMNEELRSATEELETSREELQSVNEELTTVNQELKHKLDELGHANSDLHNLMASTAIATVFIDRNLRIMRYTPSAVELFHFIPGDIGRPISDLKDRLNYPELATDSDQVLERLVPVEREVGEPGGHCYLARLLPYRTVEDHIGGVVLTFIDITERKRAEVERDRFFSFSLGLLAIASIKTGRWLRVNPAMSRTLGWSEEELLATQFLETVHPEDLPLSREAAEKLARGESLTRLEHRVPCKDGSYKWIEWEAAPYPREGLVYCSGRDVTERKRTERTIAFLAEVSAEFAAHSTTEDVMSAVGAKIANHFGISRLTFAYVDEPGNEMTPVYEYQTRGVTSSLGTKPLSDLATEADLRELAAGRILVTEDGRASSQTIVSWTNGMRTRIMAPVISDGGWRFLIVAQQPQPRRWLPDEREMFGELAARIFSRLEHARAEEALRSSDERLRLIVENAREYAIFAADLDRRVTIWNPGAERILGYTEQEIKGQSADVIFTEEDRAAGAPEEEAGTALAEGRAADERWHLRKDGTRFWGSGVMMVMRDVRGEAIGFVKILRDETNALRAKEALEQSRLELWNSLQETERARSDAEAAGLAKDHFLAVLSHELRTPLTPVLMAVSILRRRKDLPEAAREPLDMIQRNVQLEAHFIDDLLDLTRITRGKMELMSEPMDIHQAVKHAVEISEPDTLDKNQQVSVALRAEEHHLVGDSRRLQQVFWNLLKNASKFTPEGGAIRVTSRNQQERIIIEVSDSGIGFEHEAAERIFDAFAQASDAVTRQFGGLGLGLAISKATIEAHGGTLSARSAGRDQGATFCVELPLHTDV